MRTTLLTTLLAALAAGGVSEVRADGKIAAARELAEWALRKFTGKAAAEATEVLAKKITTGAARYGDDLVSAAVRKAGPKALSLEYEAAVISPKFGPAALRFVAKHGDEGAALLSKKSMKLLSYGDDATELLLKHRGVAEPLVESLGRPAVNALAAVGPRNGRRLAMLANGGELAAMGHAFDVMNVVAKFGDKAADFVWRNKGALAVGATLTAFLSDPGPFIDGAKSLPETVFEKAVAPAAMAAVAGGFKVVEKAIEPVAREATSAIPWAWLSVGGLSAGAALVAIRIASKSKAA